MDQNDKMGSRVHLADFACKHQSSKSPVALDSACCPSPHPLDLSKLELIAKAELLGSEAPEGQCSGGGCVDCVYQPPFAENWLCDLIRTSPYHWLAKSY